MPIKKSPEKIPEKVSEKIEIIEFPVKKLSSDILSIDFNKDYIKEQFKKYKITVKNPYNYFAEVYFKPVFYKLQYYKLYLFLLKIWLRYSKFCLNMR